MGRMHRLDLFERLDYTETLRWTTTARSSLVSPRACRARTAPAATVLLQAVNKGLCDRAWNHANYSSKNERVDEQFCGE